MSARGERLAPRPHSAALGPRRAGPRPHSAALGPRRAALAAALFALLTGALGCATRGAPSKAPPLPGPELGAEAPAPPEAPVPSTAPELELLLAQELEEKGDLDGAFSAYERALAGDPEDPALLTRLAQLAYRLGLESEARDYAERARAAGAEDAWLRLYLADEYRRDGDLIKVVGVLTSSSGDPVDGDAAALLYQVWFENGILEQARRVARWQVEVEPDVPAGWLNLAEATAKLGDPVRAEKILREADRAIPDDPQFLAAIAGIRRDRGDRIGELGVLNELLGRAPQDAAAWVAKAEAEFALGREDEGRRSLARAEELQPDDLRTTMRIALLDLQRGAYADADRRLSRVGELYPEQYEIAFLLGVARRRAGDTEGALLAFDRIAEGHPRFVEGRTQVAGILEAAGDYEAARVEVERAQAAKNSRKLSYYHASLVAKGGDLAAGVAELEAMLQGGPEDAETQYNIGVLLGEARDFDGAIAAMQRALEIEPQHPGALNFIGYSWAERGLRLDEAQALIERALAQRPDDGFVTDSLGWVLFMRGQAALAAGDAGGAAALFESARLKLEEAHSLTGGDPVISEHLGDVYLALGNKHTALAKYEQALRQSPRAGEQPELGAKLERLRSELGAP